MGLALDNKFNPKELKGGKLVYRASAIFSVLFIVFYGALIISLAIFTKGGDELKQFTWNIAPSFVRILVGFSVAIGLISNVLCLVALIAHQRVLALGHFWVNFVFIPMNATIFIYLLMAGSGVVAIGKKNINSNDLNDNTVRIETFSDTTQQEIIQFALDHPDEWLILQTETGNNQGCCGLNLISAYADQRFDLVLPSGVDTFDITLVFSNTGRCLVGLGAIEQMLIDFPEFSNAALEAGNASPILSSDNFFCESFLADETKSKSQGFSIMYGIATFFQAVLMFLVGLLLYSYQEMHGGFRPNEDDLAARPHTEDTVVKRAGYSKSPSSTPRGLGPVRF